jgi:GT2 family glycosyltransferase
MIFAAPMVAGRLSIVIPHWNGKPHLETCLAALQAQTYPDLEIILADNASTDGSQAYVREHFPAVIIEQLPENRGFTGACNAGMRIASGEFIALLNNDTEVDSHWATMVIDAFQRHTDVGFIASKMLLFEERDRLHTAGDFYRVDGQPGNRGAWQRDVGQYDKEEYVFSACGGSSVYRRAMLEEIGLLDDDFFFSCEDLDLAWRAQLQGHKCLYVPGAVVYHRLSASGGGVTASYYDARNVVYLLLKNYPGPLWRRYWKAILKNQHRQIREAARAWRGTAARATLRGKLAVVWDLPRLIRMLHKRRQIQKRRVISLEYLESILTPLENESPPAALSNTQQPVAIKS